MDRTAPPAPRAGSGARVFALERSLALLQGIARAAHDARGPLDAPREACRLAVELGGFRMAWYGRIDARTGAVRAVAHGGFEDGYILQSSITAREEPRGRGPTGRAIREKRPIASNDLERDPAFAPWRDAALARGYRSAVSVPIVVGGRAVSALNLYSAARDTFTPSTLRLLSAIGDVLALAEERTVPGLVQRP